MFCVECGKQNPEHGKYCHSCGSPLFIATDTAAQESPILQWQNALARYRYPANLTEFTDRQQYAGWFTRNIDTGDRDQTIQFEDFFRQNAPHHLEAWFEVVFWKLFSSHRAKTGDIIKRVEANGVSASDLWTTCCEFTADPSRQRFQAFQELLVASGNIAVCATFPAFIAPDQFPMVDRQIAKWVLENHERHNQSSRGCPVLRPPQSFDPKKGALAIRHYAFMESWTLWCRAKAKELTELTSQQWRPRDVEMAVFTAQRDGLSLPPLP